MTYPNTIPAVSETINFVAYAASAPLGQPAHAALITAAAHGSPVERFHGAIAVLAPIFEAQGSSMPKNAREALAGCLHLCTQHGWADRGGISYPATLAGVLATLPADGPADEEGVGLP